jgi:AcrR family transcriptional regulator
MAGTSPEQLRQIIVRAAIPLIGEYNTLTTAQIARAAGIEDADLVALFPDKDAVIQACMETVTAHLSAAMDPTDEIRKLDAIREEQPLTARLVEVLSIVDAYYRRVRTDLGAFEQAMATGTGTTDTPATQSSGRMDLRFITRVPELRQAVERLLEPDRQSLRLPVEALAETFLSMAHVGSRTANEERSPLPAEQVVDLFLHGALTAT